MQGGEYHASPSVGLQAPLVLPEDLGAEEEDEAGGESTGLACMTTGAGGVEETTGDAMTGEGASGAAAALVIGNEGRSCSCPASPAQE